MSKRRLKLVRCDRTHTTPYNQNC